MLTFTDTQVLAWITPLAWPFLRTLALFSALPVLGQRPVPVRVRVALAFLIALAAQAVLPDGPSTPIALDSPQMLGAVVQQLVIGLGLGFAVHIVFAAVEFAGELVGLQMGLNFAAFFDPMSGGQATAVARLFATMVAFLFIAIDGHLLVIGAVAQSLVAFPVGGEPFAFMRAVAPQAWGIEVFRLGLAIALPLVAMLLFVNLVLGVISRVAQQMNIYAVGFPVTIGVGLVGVLLTLPALQAPFTLALERMLGYFR
jgi:flagellar biosynthetic protein FliR